MKLPYDIFKVLYDSCVDCIISIEREEMLFQEVGNFNVLFSIEIEDSDSYEDDYFRPDEIDIKGFLSKYDIQRLRVSRDELVDEQYKGNKAYRTMLAIFLRHINQKFEDAVCNSCVGYIEYLDDPICDDYLNGFGFMVCIKETYWDNIDFYDWLVKESSRHYQIENIPADINCKSDKSNFDISIISTNTKARRIGYLKLILDKFKNSDVVPNLILIQAMNSSAKFYAEELKKYKNDKGLIIASKTGSSLKPYVELGLNFRLFNKNLQIYQIGKTSKAYLQSLSFSGSVFELNVIDKAYFLSLILLYDYIYIYIILFYTFINKNSSYEDLKLKFRGYLINYLEEVINNSDNDKITSAQKLKLRGIINRVNRWQKPEKYLEHVLMPRLNWLYDLDIIDLHKDLSFELTSAGRKLFGYLTILHDLSRSALFDIGNYMDSSYMAIFNNIYDLDLHVFEDKDEGILFNNVEKSFDIFKTLAYNRVTLSTMLTYVQLQLLRKNIAIDYNIIIKHVKNKSNTYIYRYQNFYNDGYIQKK